MSLSLSAPSFIRSKVAVVKIPSPNRTWLGCGDASSDVRARCQLTTSLSLRYATHLALRASRSLSDGGIALGDHWRLFRKNYDSNCLSAAVPGATPARRALRFARRTWRANLSHVPLRLSVPGTRPTQLKGTRLPPNNAQEIIHPSCMPCAELIRREART